MWKHIVAVFLLAVVAKHLFDLIMFMGFHKMTYNHKPGECRFIPGIESGSEELALLSDGIVLISTGYLSFKDRVPGAPRGYIHAYDMNGPTEGARKLSITGDYDVRELHPHGISAFEDKQTGKTFVWVISHHVGFDTVDVFEFHRNSMSLSFIKSIRDPLIFSVNNLVAISRDEFYITNEARTMQPHLRTVEDLLILRGGGIVFCNHGDAEGCRMVSEPINSPNGIALSRDGRYLYASQPFLKRVTIFKRDPSDNSLKGGKPVQSIDLGTCPDNVFVDTSGDLWFGCIPIAYKAFEHLDNLRTRVPAQIIRLRLGSDNAPHNDYAVDEVYSEEHGRNMTMTTSAVYHNNVLLFGTVHEKMMRCDVTAI